MTFAYLNNTQVSITRKLTGELREAYAPLAEDCCKAILDAISSNIAKLDSGTGAFRRLLRIVNSKE